MLTDHIGSLIKQPGFELQLCHKLSNLGHVIFSLLTVIIHSSCEVMVRTGSVSWVYSLGSCVGLCTLSGVMLCSCHIKIRNNFIYEPVFCKRGLMGPWSMHASWRDGCKMRVCHAPWTRNSSGPWCMGIQGFKLNSREFITSTICDWVSMALRGLLPFKPECLLQMQKRRQGVLGNEKDQAFWFMLLPYLANYLHWKWWPRSKRKDRTDYCSLSFPSFLTHQ